METIGDMWHPMRAQRTYDALVDLADGRIAECILSFDVARRGYPIAALRNIVDGIDALMESWPDTSVTRPEHMHDPNWCCIGASGETLAELRERVRRVLGEKVTDGTTTDGINAGTTVRDVLTFRISRETFQAITQKPSPTVERILDCHRQIKRKLEESS
jgi:hypothetical protein